jgi:hypothetical protein
MFFTAMPTPSSKQRQKVPNKKYRAFPATPIKGWRDLQVKGMFVGELSSASRSK